MSHDPTSSDERLRLLIADDDPVVRSSLSMALERRFEVVAVATDARQAAARAAETQPDVALVDVDMPEGGGRAATREIAEASPRTAVVVLSGDESESIVLELLQAGAISYCRKGVEVHQLAETIERSVRAHRELARARGAISA